MKNRISLCISRGKSWINIIHNNELIGRIAVSEMNRGNKSDLYLTSDKTVTRFFIEKEHKNNEDRFNKEEFNI